MTTDVAVLLSGSSALHDASVDSWPNFRDTICDSQQTRYRLALAAYIDQDRKVYLHSQPPWPSSEQEFRFGTAISITQLLTELVESDIFTFSLLTPTEGEEGAWQGIARVLDLKCAMSSVFCSAVARNKWAQSQLAKSFVPELELPRTVRIPTRRGQENMSAVLEQFAGQKVVLKPNSMADSQFASVHDELTEEELSKCLLEIAPYDGFALLQDYIEGMEYSVGVFDGIDGLVVLPIMELETETGFFGNIEKHTSNVTLRAQFLDAEHPRARLLADLATRIFVEMEFTVVARMDFRVTPEGIPYFLEVNSLPGLRNTSGYSLMLERAGLDVFDIFDAQLHVLRTTRRLETTLRYSIEPNDVSGISLDISRGTIN